MNRLGYFSKDIKKCHSSLNLKSIEDKSDSVYSDSEEKNLNLSDNDLRLKKNSKNFDDSDNEDLELVLSNEKEEKLENKKEKIPVEKNNELE